MIAPRKTRPSSAQNMGTATRAPLALVVAALLLGLLSCGDGTTEPAPATPPAPLPTTLTVSPGTAGLAALGATTQLSAQVFDQNGSVMTGQTIAWSSNNDAVATVGGSGLVTAVGNGTAAIRATAGTASGTATVMVAQEAASPLELAPDTASFGEDARLLSPDSLVIQRPGASVRFLPVGTDANGNALEPGATVAWSSSDAAVATVDSTGLVTAVAVGAAVVTATSGTSAAAASDGDGRTRAVAAADGSFARTTATMDVLVANTPADRGALVALYEATDGPNWVSSNGWLTDAPPGEWYGVTADVAGRVVALDLPGQVSSGTPHGLKGSIPAELGNMASLTRLVLSLNDLTGPIPVEVANMSSLKTLGLGANGLTGTIPIELGNLNSMEVLNLRNNNLSGPIPVELGNLTSLRILALDRNALTGPIPAELGNLSNMARLELFANNLTGPVPAELGNLNSLQVLSLNDNALTGPLPETFLRIGGLSWFHVGGNPSLCVPNTAAFLAWLQRIARQDGESNLCGV